MKTDRNGCYTLPNGECVSEGPCIHSSKSGYYYEHENGTIHWKPVFVVESIGPYEYFDSPFVKRWWKVE